LPLVSQGVVSGALLLDRETSGEPICTAQIIFGTAIASHVALALENARLYEQAQQALTDLKEAQEHLVRGETLRALGEVAGGAAHHLNNLLAVISGRAQLMLRDGSVGPLRRHVEIIDRMTRDSADVVRRIQMFSRTRGIEEPEPIDINQVVRQVVEMTRVRWTDAALAQGIAIDVQCVLDEVPRVSGQAAALREVVTNLVLNAVDALPAGGHITIGTRTDGTSVIVAVGDDGIGMSPDVLRRAQEPFFTTKGVKSTGLGLSVNYGIVTQHGGEIAIDSTPGRGTTVTIRLPIGPASAGPGRSACAAAPIESLRILLVDDEDDVREALAEILDAMGHAVIHARDGAEAIRQLKAGLDPDVVLTDLGMPGMTGRDVVRAVRHDWPQIPVGLITGWGVDPDAAAEPGARPDFAMSKPVNVDGLLGAIARATGPSRRGRRA
jgi:signal transduction histidine kinase/CheY-like chemotaxis protein